MKKKHRFLLIEAIVVLLVFAALLWMGIPRFLGAQSINTPENFPDPAFRSAVEAFMEVQPESPFSQAVAERASGKLLIPNYSQRPAMGGNTQPASSLKGIEFLTGITELHVLGIQSLATVDLSKNTKLESLVITNSGLETLALPQNENLKILDLSSNKLKSIDLSKTPNLTELYIYNNQLTALDTSMLKNLEVLSCGYNQLETLDLSHHPNLKRLAVPGNEFASLDLSIFTRLEELNCALNVLTDITPPFPATLTKIDLSFNRLDSVPELGSLPNVVELDLSYNLFDCGDWDAVQAALQNLSGGKTTITPQMDADGEKAVEYKCP